MKESSQVRGDEEPSVLGQACSRYLDALLSGDGEFASAVVDSAVRSKISIWDLYLHVFGGALTEIGLLWKNGKLNIAQEHLATQITLQQMERLKLLFKPKESINARALITCVAGNPHFVGARLVADFFYYDGWEVDFLGADMPCDDLIRFMEPRNYDVLGLSCSFKSHLIEATKVVTQVRERLPNTRVLLGGRGTKEDPEGAELVGADWIADDILDAIRKARESVDMHGAVPSLDKYLVDVGIRVQQLRKSREMSQHDLAQAADLDRAYLSAVENGKQNVSLSALHKIAKGLGVSIDRILIAQQ